LVQNRTIQTEHRKDAQKLLQALLGQLVPSMRKVPATEPTIYAALVRYSMLVDYERELARLQEIMQRTRRNPANRLRTLEERYPTIPRTTLERWKTNHCEQIALELVSTRNAMATHTVRKALTQARQERQQRQRAHPSPDATA
jgi:hypothetical protein